MDDKNIRLMEDIKLLLDNYVSIIVPLALTMIAYGLLHWLRIELPKLLLSISYLRKPISFQIMALSDDVNEEIFSLERRFDIRLTQEARQLLILPILEYENERGHQEISKQKYREIWLQSLVLIFSTIKDDKNEFRTQSEEERYASDKTIF